LAVSVRATPVAILAGAAVAICAAYDRSETRTMWVNYIDQATGTDQRSFVRAWLTSPTTPS